MKSLPRVDFIRPLLAVHSVAVTRWTTAVLPLVGLVFVAFPLDG